MANNHSELEKRLWDAADDLRANSKLKSSEYSVSVLGLIFLRYADHKFTVAEAKLAAAVVAIGKAVRNTLTTVFWSCMALTCGDNAGAVYAWARFRQWMTKRLLRTRIPEC